MNISVKQLNGRTTSVEIQSSHSIEYLKGVIQDKEGIPADQQRINFYNITLENNKTLHDYGIGDGAVCTLITHLGV